MQEVRKEVKDVREDVAEVKTAVDDRGPRIQKLEDRMDGKSDCSDREGCFLAKSVVFNNCCEYKKGKRVIDKNCDFFRRSAVIEIDKDGNWRKK